MKYFPPRRAGHKLLFIVAPGFSFMQKGRYEGAGFHTLFYLDDVLLCHLNRCYSDKKVGYLFPHHLSESKQANKPSERAILEAIYQKMPTTALWLVLLLNSKHCLFGFPCLNYWHERCNFILKAGCSSGTEPTQFGSFTSFSAAFPRGFYTSQKPII